jgi:hypothetical protein
MVAVALEGRSWRRRIGGGSAEEVIGAGRGGEAPRQRAGRGRGGRWRWRGRRRRGEYVDAVEVLLLSPSLVDGGGAPSLPLLLSRLHLSALPVRISPGAMGDRKLAASLGASLNKSYAAQGT